jgi:hypothetical protein
VYTFKARSAAQPAEDEQAILFLGLWLAFFYVQVHYQGFSDLFKALAGDCSSREGME